VVDGGQRLSPGATVIVKSRLAAAAPASAASR
jgi:hypothetical protein